jgi:hypothetical protein
MGFLYLLIFKGLTARLLYMSFGVKGLNTETGFSKEAVEIWSRFMNNGRFISCEVAKAL